MELYVCTPTLQMSNWNRYLESFKNLLRSDIIPTLSRQIHVYPRVFSSFLSPIKRRGLSDECKTDLDGFPVDFINCVSISYLLIPAEKQRFHYSDGIMGAMATQITGVSVVCSAVCWGADQRKPQSSASLAFVGGIHRWPVDSRHKGPVRRKMFPFDDVIMPVGWSHWSCV